jgi:hypothetical protein
VSCTVLDSTKPLNTAAVALIAGPDRTEPAVAVVEIVGDGTLEDAVVPVEVVTVEVVPVEVVPVEVVPIEVVPVEVVPVEVVPVEVVPVEVVPVEVAPAEVAPAEVVPAVVVPAVVVPAEVVPVEVVPVEVAPAEAVALAPGVDDSTVLDVEKVESLDPDGASTSLLLDSEVSIAAEALVLGVGVLFDMVVDAVVPDTEGDCSTVLFNMTVEALVLDKDGSDTAGSDPAVLGDLEEVADVEELTDAGTVSGEVLVPVLGVGAVASAWVKLWRGGNAT